MWHVLCEFKFLTLLQESVKNVLSTIIDDINDLAILIESLSKQQRMQMTNCLLTLINIIFSAFLSAIFMREPSLFLLSILNIRIVNTKKHLKCYTFAVARGFASILPIVRRDAPVVVLTMLKIIPRGRVRAKSIKSTAKVIAKWIQCCDVSACQWTTCDMPTSYTRVGREGGQVLSIIMLRMIFVWLIVSLFLQLNLSLRIIKFLSHKWIEIIQIMAASRKFIVSFIRCNIISLFIF